jgi:hypothetical protein
MRICRTPNLSFVLGLGFLFTVEFAPVCGQPSQHLPDQCHDVLIKTDLTKVDTQMKKVAYLQLIETKEDWQSAKNEGGGLSAIFDNIPVAATLDFSSFQQWQKSVVSESSFLFNDDEAHFIQTSFISSSEVSAWAKCMGRDAGGLTLTIDNLTQSTADVHLYWVAPNPGIGLKSTPVTIKQGAPPAGGALNGPWPLNGSIEGNIDKTLRYQRKPHEDLIVIVDVADKKGNNISRPIRIPAEPEFITSCTRQLKGLFSGVPVDPTGFTVACSQFEPGKKVMVSFSDSKFKVDEPGTIWIVLGASIAGGQIIIPPTTVLYIRFWGIVPPTDDAPKPWVFSHVVSVPWDGIVDTTIFVDRAEILPGVMRTLSATDGSYVVKTQ